MKNRHKQLSKTLRLTRAIHGGSLTTCVEMQKRGGELLGKSLRRVPFMPDKGVELWMYGVDRFLKSAENVREMVDQGYVIMEESLAEKGDGRDENKGEGAGKEAASAAPAQVKAVPKVSPEAAEPQISAQAKTPKKAAPAKKTPVKRTPARKPAAAKNAAAGSKKAKASSPRAAAKKSPAKADPAAAAAGERKE